MNPGEDRLSSIDLLRAAAALAVATFHAFHMGVSADIHAPKDLHYALSLPVSFGYAGVYLFFVISGFCIHMRWARATAAGQAPKADFVAFWKRRIRRLYPAYAAALAIGIALSVRVGVGWSGSFAADIGSHLLLVHNFHPSTLYSINPVFWTLAIEEQLYLLYFLLLWLRRRYSWTTIIMITIGVRVVWHGLAFLFARHGVTLVVSGSAQATWFIWVLGALAVEAYFDVVKLPTWCRSIPLAFVIFVATIAIAMLDRLHDSVGMFHTLSLVLEQPGWALGSFILLNAIVRRETWLSARRSLWYVAPWLWVGLVSYSLYLFHMYIFEGAKLWYLLGLVAAVAAAGIGYTLFERPFIRKRVAPSGS